MQKQIDLQKIERSPDCISGFDDNLHVVIWNDSIARKYNILKADAIGKHILELFPQIEGDFRITCMRQAVSDKKMFYFSALPYAFGPGIYTQLILPGKEYHNFHVLSVVREHKQNEVYPRTEILDSIMTPLPLVG